MSNFVKDEPAISVGLATAATGWVLSFLVLHGVVTGTQASAVSQAVVPVVASGLVMAAAFIVRRWVSPAWKSIVHFTEEHVPSLVLQEASALVKPEDLAALEARLKDYLVELGTHLSLSQPNPAGGGGGGSSAVNAPGTGGVGGTVVSTGGVAGGVEPIPEAEPPAPAG